MARATNKETCKIRVVAVYRMILRGQKMTTKEIIHELESHYGISVDRKTIISDIAAINRIIPVRSSGGRGGYCLWDVAKEAQDSL